MNRKKPMNAFNPTSYPFEKYPKVRKVRFPESLPIAYAVCSRECGNRQFIVDGSTQVCEYCGGLMFRISTRTYLKKRAARKPARRGVKPTRV